MAELERKILGMETLVDVSDRDTLQSTQVQIENTDDSLDDAALDLLFMELINEAEKDVLAGTEIEPERYTEAEIDWAVHQLPLSSGKSDGTSTSDSKFPMFEFDSPSSSEIDDEKLTRAFAEKDFKNKFSGDFDSQSATEKRQPTEEDVARNFDVKEYINNLWQELDETISRFDTLNDQFGKKIIKYRLINYLLLSLVIVALVISGVMVFIGIDFKNHVDSSYSLLAVNEQLSRQPSDKTLQQQVVELQAQMAVIQSVLKARQSENKLLVEDIRGITEQLSKIQSLFDLQSDNQNRIGKEMSDSSQPSTIDNKSQPKSQWNQALSYPPQNND